MYAIVDSTNNIAWGESVPKNMIEFPGGNSVCMEAVICGDDNILCVGPDCETLLKNGKVRRDQVFTLPKLSLLRGREEEVLDQSGPESDTAQADRTAMEIEEAHQKAFEYHKDQLIRVPLPYDQTHYEFTLRTPSDIIQGITVWLWYWIKHAIITQVGDPTNALPEVFASQARVVASVPEMWTDAMIDQFRHILNKVGFPGGVYPVSETKCCAMALAHEKWSSIHWSKPDLLGLMEAEALRTVIIVFDLGAGTMDLASFIITETRPMLKARTLVPSSGRLWGAQQQNQILKKRVPGLIGRDFADLVRHRSRDFSGGEYNEELILEPFARGFEMAKRKALPESTNSLYVDFESWPPLPPVAGPTALQDGSLVVSRDEMRSIMDVYVQELHGPIADQLRLLNEAGAIHENTRVELHCVGGGSKSQYIIDNLRNRFPQVTAVVRQNVDYSTVAFGGVLLGIDPEAGTREFVRVGWGAVYEEDKEPRSSRTRIPRTTLGERIFWALVIGQRIEGSEYIQGDITIEEKDLPYDDANTSIELEMVLYKTDRAELCKDGIE